MVQWSRLWTPTRPTGVLIPAETLVMSEIASSQNYFYRKSPTLQKMGTSESLNGEMHNVKRSLCLTAYPL